MVSAVAIAVLLAACVAPAAEPRSDPPTTSRAPRSSPAPTKVEEPCTIELSATRLDVSRTAGATLADERSVRGALRSARRYFDVRVPQCRTASVRAIVTDRASADFAAVTSVRRVPRFQIRVLTGGSPWQQTPRRQIPVIMLHEWYHVVQYSFLRCAAPRCHVPVRPIPDWLIEGGAEYAAARAAQDLGAVPDGFIREYELARAAQDDTALQRLGEVRSGSDYGLSFAAMELLMSHAPPRALLDLWRRAGATGRWAAVFSEVFGRSPARFYRQFAAYRLRGFRA